MIEAAYGVHMTGSKKYIKDTMQEVMEWTMDCIAHSDIITIFDIRRCAAFTHFSSRSRFTLLSRNIFDPGQK